MTVQYKTILVEDDPMVRMLNRAYLERDGRFRLAGEFGDGRTALSWLRSHPVDLAILDVYMPVFTGLDLLRELRAQRIPLDAVMVTAANDAKTVEALLQLGVVDYLVKPFTRQRFGQALDVFCAHREAIGARQSVTQSEIDRMLSRPAEASAPKGLQEKTLALVRRCLAKAPERGFASEEVALRTGLSAVTARRYLNYMQECGEAVGTADYDTGGRPSIRYRLEDGGEPRK